MRLPLYLIFLVSLSVRADIAPDPMPETSRRWIRQHPVIVAATYAEGYAPFERVHDGHVDGLAPDYLRKLAADLGIAVRFQVYQDWPAAMTAAQRGEVDILMDVAPTPDRNGKLLVGAPYYESAPVLVVRRDDTRIARFDDLRGRRVAVQARHAEDDVLRRYAPQVQVMTVPDVASALRELDRGEADAVIGDPHVLEAAIGASRLHDRLRIGASVPLPMATLSFAVASERGRVSLLTALDHALNTLTPSEHARLRSPWIDDTPGHFAADLNVPLSASERAWLATLPPLRIGIDPSAVPITLLGRDGGAEGLAADYLREVCRALGLRITLVPTANWEETVRRAIAGDIDLLPAASPHNTELAQHFDFTSPYVAFPMMAATREDAAPVMDADDLAGQRIAINPARPAALQAANDIKATETLAVDSAPEGLDAVLSRRVDAYLGDVASIDYLLRRDYPGRLKMSGPIGESDEIAMAVQRRYAPLVPLLSRVLARLPERRQEGIRNTWLRSTYTWGGSWPEIARKAGPTGLAIVALLLVVSHAYLRLRREIRRRQRSEEQLADVTRSVPAVVYRFRYHDDGRIEFTYLGGNPEPIFGVGEDVFLRDERSAFARIDPRDQGSLQAEVARAAATLTPIHAEMRIRDSDPVRWVASHAMPRRQPGGVDFTGYWIDVSDRHVQSTQLAAAKDAAEHATQAKSQFLATMSHEIRTPMHGVIGMLEMLGETPLSDEQHRLLDTAEHSAEALLQILDDVLDFSRIEAGRLDIEPTAVDVRVITEGIVDLFGWQARRKGLSLSLHVDDEVAACVRIDGVRLRQVLLNLVSNAVKFTAHGHVRLHVEMLGEENATQHVRFTVEDTGIGIAEDDAARLFAPFSQAESSTTRRFGGSGLGLAICRRLVELLDGTITLDSRLGHGTRMSVAFMLPRCTSLPMDANQAEPPPSRRTLDVLVAEDHPINRELVVTQLTRLGHRCRVATDGDEALALALAALPDVLLTDLHMPGLDGYALTQELRRRHMPIRIVAMTANALAGERERCLASGMDDFLLKPVRLDALRLVLDQGIVPLDESAPWDLALLRDTFGDLDILPRLVTQFVAAAREDSERIALLDDPALVAERVHRLLGGMRVFGTSPEARAGEALECELRGIEGIHAMRRVPAFLCAIDDYAKRLEQAVAML